MDIKKIKLPVPGLSRSLLDKAKALYIRRAMNCCIIHFDMDAFFAAVDGIQIPRPGFANGKKPFAR